MPRPDILEFRAKLRIDKHDLDGELEVHAECQEAIARVVAGCNTLQLEAKRAVEAVEAEVVDALKRQSDKMSNPVAEKEAKRSSKYAAAWGAYQTARQLYEEWAGLHSAWVTRGYNLKTLADLHGQQYFSVTTTTMRPSADTVLAEERRRIRDAVPSRRPRS